MNKRIAYNEAKRRLQDQDVNTNLSPVVQDALMQSWSMLEDEVYLHTEKKSYSYVTTFNPYQRIGMKNMDEIWEKTIQIQRAREVALFNSAGINCSDPREGCHILRNMLLEAGGLLNLFSEKNSLIREHIADMIMDAFDGNWMWNTPATTQVLDDVYDQLEIDLQNKLNTISSGYTQELTGAIPNDGIWSRDAVKSVVSILRKYDSDRKELNYNTLEDYMNTVSGRQAIGRNKKGQDTYSNALSGFKGELLEQAVASGLSKVFKNLTAGNTKVEVVGGELVNNVQQKTDVKVYNKTLSWGISVKSPELKPQRQESFEVQTGGKFQNFIDLLMNGDMIRDNSGNRVDNGEFARIAEEFDSSKFKYHLINDTLFSSYHPEKTPTGKDFLELLKQGAFLFVGAALLRAEGVQNVDFMFINNVFVPVSEIMSKAGDLKISFQNKMGFDKVPKLSKGKMQILAMKQEETATEASDYYSAQALTIGKSFGEEMLKNIRYKKVMLSLNIANFM